MQIELFVGGAFFFARGHPRLGHGFAARDAAGGLALEDRNRIAGVDFRVGENFKAAAVDGHRAFGAEELKSGCAAFAAAGFVVSPGGGEAAVFKLRVLRVWSFAVVFESIAAADRRRGQWAFLIEVPLHDVDGVRAQIGHLAAGEIPKPAEVVDAAVRRIGLG